MLKNVIAFKTNFCIMVCSMKKLVKFYFHSSLNDYLERYPFFYLAKTRSSLLSIIDSCISQ